MLLKFDKKLTCFVSDTMRTNTGTHATSEWHTVCGYILVCVWCKAFRMNDSLYRCMDFFFVRACLACEWRETNENYIVLIKRVIGNSWDSNFPDDVSYLKWKYVRVVHLRFVYTLFILLNQLSVQNMLYTPHIGIWRTWNIFISLYMEWDGRVYVWAEEHPNRIAEQLNFQESTGKKTE